MAIPHRRRRSALRQSVTARMRNPAGEARGPVRQLSTMGCSIELPGAAPFERGSKVMLQLNNVLLLEPIQTVGVVRALPGEDGTLLGLEFADPAQLECELPPSLIAVFNRRKATRLDVGDVVTVHLDGPVLDADAYCEASLETTPGQDTLALLVNVSVDGVALRLETEVAAALELGTQLELSFALPDVAEPFSLSGAVRSTWPDGEYVACGIQFDPSSSGFKQQRSRLRAAVVRRMEQLRARRRQ